jgi:hypothetical protein
MGLYVGLHRAVIAVDLFTSISGFDWYTGKHVQLADILLTCPFSAYTK